MESQEIYRNPAQIHPEPGDKSLANSFGNHMNNTEETVEKADLQPSYRSLKGTCKPSLMFK